MRVRDDDEVPLRGADAQTAVGDRDLGRDDVVAGRGKVAVGARRGRVEEAEVAGERLAERGEREAGERHADVRAGREHQVLRLAADRERLVDGNTNGLAVHDPLHRVDLDAHYAGGTDTGVGGRAIRQLDRRGSGDLARETVVRNQQLGRTAGDVDAD